MSTTQVLTADLGPHVAAVTCRINDQPVAIVNTAATRDNDLRKQAIWALIGAGVDAGLILGVLHGVRS